MPKKELNSKLQNVLDQTNEFLNYSIDHVVGIRDDVLHGLKDLHEELSRVRNDVSEVVDATDAVALAYRNARKLLADAEGRGDALAQAKAYDEAEHYMKLRSSFEEREKYLRRRRDDLEREKVRMGRIMNHSTDMMGKLRLAVEILRNRVENMANISSERDLRMVVFALQFAERENARLAREIHDGPIQQFAGAILLFEYLERLVDADKFEETKAEVKKIKGQLKDALGDFRGFLLQLQPVGLDKGIEKALSRLAENCRERYGVKVLIEMKGEKEEFPLMLRANVFRVLQEAISNAIRHGKATVIKITVLISPEKAIFTVMDNGIGFNVDDGKKQAVQRGSFGLSNMAERIRFANGHFKIESTSGKGTLINIAIPLKEGS